MSAEHESVMVAEIVELMSNFQQGVVVDGTVGLGGHAAAILGAAPAAVRLVAFDRDPGAVELSRKRLSMFGDRAEVLHGGYEEARNILNRRGISSVQGVLLDLGLSSAQLDGGRGFSVQSDAPLDMRFDPNRGPTAADVLRQITEPELAAAFKELGQLPRSRRLARAIKTRASAGRMNTTSDFVDACREVLGPRLRRMPAAVVPAMVLRILTNRELDRLDDFLRVLPDLLAPGGVAAVLSYHSGEDGRVKRAFREAARSGRFHLPFKKGIVPGEDEVRRNPRARAARLRVLVRNEEESS